ncbi:MAG: GIY-YIG nuclease family protein [gamma proteobacterium endosymbiont of Lamellibrachia anaximandri]|nr:GIY-YIG nuclease family protein [gamma proteobacterium endosymbiont of Lamellibrachia anaximandri]MBL3535439.1 GIY-YIG nuclease family protein [gamma proteobacterium endosymbiont of Lamellibrachia anaximandri]MBL3600916.1 GIY-YIG nuclease family protein [gamma proteobacterium endosymbiont of Lamellibrachia anaximandri]
MSDSFDLWHVYILKCGDGTLYTGIAKDVVARVKKHNSGQGAKYTRGRLPVELLYTESVGPHGDALRREMEIKRLSAANKNKLVYSG